MKTKAIMLVALLLCAAATPVSAAVFGWTGASNQYWGNENNWDSLGCSVDCYPHTTSDDATVALDDDVTLDANYGIDDLTVANPGSSGGPTFSGGGTVYTLTVDSFTIAGGASNYTEVTLEGKGVIETN